MKKLNLYAKRPKIKYRSYRGEFNKTFDNLLLDKLPNKENNTFTYVRNFTTTDVNQKRTTDVTEFSIPAGKLYLSPILDMHNREIVAYVISKSANLDQTMNMLKKAFKRFSNLEGLIFHSDQGWQYHMSSYQRELKKRGIQQSMSRKGNCLDNSPMENFFAVLKNEMFYEFEETFKTLDDLEKAIIEYIKYYNSERIMEKLKGLSPIEYRQQSMNSLLWYKTVRLLGLISVSTIFVI